MIKDKAMELVAALRSGKYKQGRHHLLASDNYCCLGVACELAGLKPVVVNETGGHGFLDIDGEERVVATLPTSVMDKFGIDCSVGGFNVLAITVPGTFGGPHGLDGRDSLAAMNDNGFTFNQIADFIEMNWEHL